MNTYQQKLEARKARYEERAERARQEAQQRGDSAFGMARILQGEPVKVGHHSERRHRRDIERMDNNMRKAVEASKKAEYYERRAASAGKTGISSDDPEAVDKIRAKIAKLEAKQETMKAANKALRKGDDDALHALGFTDAQIVEFKEPDFAGRVGVPGYMLSNNNANIRRLKQRISQLEAAQAAEHKETEYSGFSVVENVKENRIQIIFPGKPSAEVRATLKSCGFRWSRYNSAWQRHLNNAGRHAAERVIKELESS